LSNFLIKDMLLSKMIDFRDEQEFRFLLLDKSNADPSYFLFENSLKAIILGVNHTQQQLTALNNALHLFGKEILFV